jgi:hypothetical protein
MKTANGEQMQCPGKVTISLNSRISLSNVLHCPSTSINLLSVAQLCDLGLCVKFTTTKCKVTEIATGLVVLKSVRERNLYIYLRENCLWKRSL